MDKTQFQCNKHLSSTGTGWNDGSGITIESTSICPWTRSETAAEVANMNNMICSHLWTVKYTRTYTTVHRFHVHEMRANVIVYICNLTVKMSKEMELRMVTMWFTISMTTFLHLSIRSLRNAIDVELRNNLDIRHWLIMERPKWNTPTPLCCRHRSVMLQSEDRCSHNKYSSSCRLWWPQFKFRSGTPQCTDCLRYRLNWNLKIFPIFESNVYWILCISSWWSIWVIAIFAAVMSMEMEYWVSDLLLLRFSWRWCCSVPLDCCRVSRAITFCASDVYVGVNGLVMPHVYDWRIWFVAMW